MKEELEKKFKVSYNYDDVNVDKMNPEQRLLWAMFGRLEDKEPALEALMRLVHNNALKMVEDTVIDGIGIPTEMDEDYQLAQLRFREQVINNIQKLKIESLLGKE